MKKIISTDKAPQAIGPYSQAIQTDTMIFCSGQIALTPAGVMADNDIVLQVGQVMENLTAVLAAADASLGDVVKTTIYLVDLTDFQVVNEIYGKYFGGAKPARATVQVAALPKGAKVEIDAIAVR